MICDICVTEDAGIVEDLYLEDSGREARGQAGALAFTISPNEGAVAGERLVEEAIDLPRINYGRCNERPYSYVWGVGTDPARESGFFDRIVAVDVRERTTRTWSERDCFPGEPVFVAEPGAPRRTRAHCSRSCSTPARGPRFCSFSMRAT